MQPLRCFLKVFKVLPDFLGLFLAQFVSWPSTGKLETVITGNEFTQGCIGEVECPGEA